MKKIINLIALVSMGACMKYTPVKKVVVVEPPRTQAKPGIPVGELSLTAGLGDLEGVKKLLAEGADLNESVEVDGVILNPLMVALAEGKEDVAKFLVAKGARGDATVQGYSLGELALESELNSLAELLALKK
jgi:hypothetical protein